MSADPRPLDSALEITAFVHPTCSKCRGLRALLEERRIPVRWRPYLEQPPSVEELEGLLAALGEEDPRVLVREKEDLYRELGLARADRRTLLEAIAAHPRLLVRPLVAAGERAVLARPPERALAFLEELGLLPASGAGA